MSSASGLFASFSQHSNSMRQGLGQGYAHIDRFVKEKAGVNVAALQEAGYGLPAFGPQWEQAKERSKSMVSGLGESGRAKVMFYLLNATKSAATSDPDMPECVRSRVNDLVEVFWGDLTIFVEQTYQDAGKKIGSADELDAKGTKPMCLGPRWWRALVLNTLAPFDRSIFYQIKSPVWWILTLISLVPAFGIRVAFFSMVLMLIIAGWPADEFQLVTYILGFKGSQFISSGVVQACVAAMKYYMCVHSDGTHTCNTDGPGVDQDLPSGLIDFIGSCVLTWIAFLWLPCSTRSAGVRDAVETITDAEAQEDNKPTKTCCGSVDGYDASKGGRLRGLLVWDIVCFLLSCGFCFGLMYIDAAHLRKGGADTTSVSIGAVLWDSCTWEGHTAIYWARIFYAFLSFPFVVFLIPGLNSVLTHTTPTGYNRNGLCVPLTMRERPADKAK